MTNKKLTTADLVVLSLLTEEPMHGYQVVSQLQYRDAKDWAEVSRPQVYYSLKKLHELKLIVPSKRDDSALGPERTQFKITRDGVQAMNEALVNEDWATQRPPPPFLTWMALSSHLSKKDSKHVIHLRKQFLKKEIERERKTLKAVFTEEGAMNTSARLMVSFTIQIFEAELKWLDEVEKALESVRK